MKKAFKYLFFIAITIIMVLIIVLNNDMNEIGKELSKVNPMWLWIAFGVLIVYLLVNPLSLMIVAGNDKNIKKRDSFMIGSIEYFFNGVTPSNTGAQPMQILEYSRIGVSGSKATGSLLINSTINQFAIVILCLVSLVYYGELSKGVDAIQILIIVGLVLNLLVLALYASVGLSKTIKNLLIRFMDFICSRKIFKGKLNKLNNKFKGFCDNSQNAFKDALKSRWRIVFALITKLIALLLFYSLPFFILKSLGISVGPSDFMLMIAMTTFSIAMTCFIPTPGSSGGIEFAFKSLFINFAGVTGAVATSGMLLWRLLTYYLLMLISLITYIVFELVVVKKYRKKQESVETENVDNKIIYKMKLYTDSFNLIRDRKKTIEMRLNDEKRQAINVGDIIEFTNTATNEKIKVEVLAKNSYKSFKELYKAHNKLSLGYKALEEANPLDMNKYYSNSDIEKYGVIAIEIKLLETSE